MGQALDSMWHGHSHMTGKRNSILNQILLGKPGKYAMLNQFQ